MHRLSLIFAIGMLLNGFMAANASTTVATRVFCETSASGANSSLRTFLARPFAQQATDLQDLVFLDTQSKRVNFIGHIPLWSDGFFAEVLLVSSESLRGRPRQVFLGNVSYKRPQGDAYPIAEYPSLQSARELEFLALGMKVRHMAVDDSKSLLIIPSMSGQMYELVDFRTGTRLRSIPVNPNQWVNPVSSAFSNNVVVQSWSPRNLVTLQLWNSLTGQTQDLKVAQFGHQLHPEFLSDRWLTWLDWAPLESSIWLYDLKEHRSILVKRFLRPLKPAFAAGYQRHSGEMQALLLGNQGMIHLKFNLDGTDVVPQSRDIPAMGRMTGAKWSPWNQNFLIFQESSLEGLLAWSETEGFQSLISSASLEHCHNTKLIPEFVVGGF